MSLPRGSLGFLNDKAERPRGFGRIRDRLWLGRPDRGELALSYAEGNNRDRQRESDAQPLSDTERRPPTLAGSAGHVPRRREHRTDVSDELGVDRGTDPL